MFVFSFDLQLSTNEPLFSLPPMLWPAVIEFMTSQFFFFLSLPSGRWGNKTRKQSFQDYIWMNGSLVLFSFICELNDEARFENNTSVWWLGENKLNNEGNKLLIKNVETIRKKDFKYACKNKLGSACSWVLEGGFLACHSFSFLNCFSWLLFCFYPLEAPLWNADCFMDAYLCVHNLRMFVLLKGA